MAFGPLKALQDVFFPMNAMRYQRYQQRWKTYNFTTRFLAWKLNFLWPKEVYSKCDPFKLGVWGFCFTQFLGKVVTRVWRDTWILRFCKTSMFISSCSLTEGVWIGGWLSWLVWLAWLGRSRSKWLTNHTNHPFRYILPLMTHVLYVCIYIYV